ncbi:hypothetical protein CGZ93_01450 [Enemella dayhoffiae]|uniref:Uncharacterized protein n=1 Tax=Enemella dayhoffiae TaxID=2016507 RepID=A0A255HB70_9ACTN|nr:hypothetical protein [Enemella dayhoffiae]OYO25150.1 hypothetical protein CGZ93_01450 [Enemella dayhoffiae]
MGVRGLTESVRAEMIILNGVAAGRPRVLVGGDARLPDGLVRLLPDAAPPLIARVHRRVVQGLQTGEPREGVRH